MDKEEIDFLTEVKRTQEWLYVIVCGLVDVEDQIFISAYVTDLGVMFQVKVAPADIGKMIGKQGRMARALRSILNTRGRKDRTRYTLDIEEHSGEAYAAPTDASGVLIIGGTL